VPLDVLDELLDDAEVDVGLQQCDADLAQGRFHIFGRQFSFAAQVFEDPLGEGGSRQFAYCWRACSNDFR